MLYGPFPAPQPFPLVSTRKPVPDWLPLRWESSSYPRIPDIEAVREWLDSEEHRWKTFTPDVLRDMVAEGYLANAEAMLVPASAAVRDGYRLVDYCVKKHHWKNGPKKPKGELTDCPSAAAELQRISEWIDGCLTKTNRRGAKARKDATPRKRSWTQKDLDAAIQQYKAERASNYHDWSHRCRPARREPERRQVRYSAAT